MLQYFDQVAQLSDKLATAMARGLGAADASQTITKDRHTSYLRLNYYPVHNETNDPNAAQQLGIERSCSMQLRTIGIGDLYHADRIVYHGDRIMAFPMQAYRCGISDCA